MENQEYQQKLEELIHRELQKLPERRAPETLIPRVLAAIQAQAERPWWRQSWSAWPPKMQLLFLTVSLSLFGLALMGGSLWWESAGLSGMPQQIGHWLRSLQPLWDVAVTLANAVLVLVRASLGHPGVILALIFCLLMYVACLGLGTACYRVALNRNFKRY